MVEVWGDGGILINIWNKKGHLILGVYVLHILYGGSDILCNAKVL